MARKIKAKTLGRLASAYVDAFPEEAAACMEDSSAEEGAELFSLLPAASAWALVRRLPPETGRRWLAGSDEEALERLIGYVSPEAPLEKEAPLSVLRNKALELLEAHPG